MTTPLAGRYVLTDQIGLGGMGSVWRAWDLKEQRYVAAKILSRYDSGMVQRFVREQGLRIQHEYVVTPTGWSAEDERVLFTMDLVRGGSVDDLLGRHGPLPDDYVRVILDQTLQALQAVHRAGVVHRDLKPGNLLLEPTGTGRPWVRLSDFGVAGVVDDVRFTMVGGGVGTGGYMPPEQEAGAPPDPRQDLYALGIVGIQMLTALPPRQQQGPPRGPLNNFLAVLTATSPEARFPDADAARQALWALGVTAGTPWQDRPDPPHVIDQLGDPPPPAIGPNHSLAALICFLLAIAFSVIAVFLML